MRPYRNIYILFEKEDFILEGSLDIPYTGEIYYGVEEEDLPDSFDEDRDVYYKCPCDLGEFRGFKKI